LHAGPPPNLKKKKKIQIKFKNYAIFVNMQTSRKTPQSNESFHNGPLFPAGLHVSSWILLIYLWIISISSYYNTEKSQNNKCKNIIIFSFTKHFTFIKHCQPTSSLQSPVTSILLRAQKYCNKWSIKSLFCCDQYWECTTYF
jgi:hypothetical protein